MGLFLWKFESSRPHQNKDWFDYMNNTFKSNEFIGKIQKKHPADQAEAIENLEISHQILFLKYHVNKLQPDFIAYLRDDSREQILSFIPKKKLITFIKTLDVDDAVEILGDFQKEDLISILAKLGANQRIKIEESLAYPEESAGRIMNKDFLSVTINLTVGELIDHLRKSRKGPKDFYNVFIVDNNNIPIGYIPCGRILRSKKTKKLSEIYINNIHKIAVNSSFEDISFIFRKYGLVSTPVVDYKDNIIGIIAVDDVVDIVHEEDSDDIQKLGGLFVNDFYKGAFSSASTRFVWLGLNLFTAIIASLVIDIYAIQLQQMIAIAVLMPIVASMGGNAGTQAMTIYVRAIATKDLIGSNYTNLIIKEFLIGSINGFLLSIIMGLIAFFWFDNLILAFAVGISILINLGFACIFGILIPLTMNKLKIDPALASGIILTTFTDVFGFLSFLSIATYIINF